MSSTEEPSSKVRMADAISEVLIPAGDFYRDLTDDDLHDFADVLWGYHEDLCNEWVRRQRQKASDERT